MNSPIYAPRFTSGPALFNLSSRTLEPLEIQTLEIGPKVSFLPKQVSVADLISSLESSLHKFYSSISNPDEARASLIDTLYNNKKMHNPPAN